VAEHRSILKNEGVVRILVIFQDRPTFSHTIHKVSTRAFHWCGWYMLKNTWIRTTRVLFMHPEQVRTPKDRCIVFTVHTERGVLWGLWGRTYLLDEFTWPERAAISESRKNIVPCLEGFPKPQNESPRVSKSRQPLLGHTFILQNSLERVSTLSHCFKIQRDLPVTALFWCQGGHASVQDFCLRIIWQHHQWIGSYTFRSFGNLSPC